MFDYIKATMSSMYKEDIDMTVEEFIENNIKYYTEEQLIEQYGEKVKMFYVHAKINSPEELQLLVEKVAAGGIDMSFEFKTNKKR